MAETPLVDVIDELPDQGQGPFLESLPPQTLEELANSDLAEEVYQLVQELIENGVLTDEQGEPVAEQDVPPGPADALQQWAQGEYGTPSYPVLDGAPPPDAVILAKFDGAFFPAGQSPALVQRGTLSAYDRVVAGGGAAGLRVRTELRTYARDLARAGRVRDRDEGDVVAPDTGPDVVLDGVRNGLMEFMAPPGSDV